MTTVAGANQWVNAVERADDGDTAVGATWQSTDELANRTAFLLQNSQLAIANHKLNKTSTSADWYNAVCHGVGAGPYNYGLYCAVGQRTGGGAAFAYSYDGEA